MSIANKLGLPPQLRRLFRSAGAASIPWATPENADDAAVTVQQAIIETVMDTADNGTVTFEGVTYTFDSTPTPADNEFDDCAALADIIDDLDDWGAAGVTNLVITAAEGGTRWNDRMVTSSVIEAETAGGSAGEPATADISAAATGAMAVGDVVVFDGVTFTRADSTDVGDREFEDAAGLALCIDDMTSWGGSEAMDVVTVTRDGNGAEWNDMPIEIIYYRATAGGDNGTPGTQGAICTDGDYIYISGEAAGLENDSWVRLDAQLETF